MKKWKDTEVWSTQMLTQDQKNLMEQLMKAMSHGVWVTCFEEDQAEKQRL